MCAQDHQAHAKKKYWSAPLLNIWIRSSDSYPTFGQQAEQSEVNDKFVFAVNIQVPGSRHFSIVYYYVLHNPIDKVTSDFSKWTRWLKIANFCRHLFLDALSMEQISFEIAASN